jgi:hypothetical protein
MQTSDKPLILMCVGTDEASHPQSATKYKEHIGADEDTSQTIAREVLFTTAALATMLPHETPEN